MCGRYTNEAEFSEIRLAFKVGRADLFRSYRPTFNISPSYGPGFEQLIVVRAADGSREIKLGRWWMIPALWKKPLKELPTSFNARAEEIATKPFWKDAFRSSRCLIPATGWREFKGSKGHKQPYHFRTPQRVFAFAGVWSTWRVPDAGQVDSFAIITTEPNAAAEVIHNRMPLLMAEANWDAWLGPDSDPQQVLASACRQSQSMVVDVYPSNPIGNRSGFEGPEAIEPVEK